ncbi:MAG: hypothetical protein OEW31_04260 [Thermoleophilia bacterium]|nr:hypothetical protein [Thermoleophilia bacterium]MDH4345531.1 hypothetical protein [Thermoleophilia bacterium]
MPTTFHSTLVDALRGVQRVDGAFGLTVDARAEPEPTAVAALALDDASARRWLASRQGADGGFAEHDGLVEDCASTALAALALDRRSAALRALDYAVARRSPQIGESGDENGDGRDGWGWTPDTYSWVEPTSRVLIATRVLRPGDATTRAEAVHLLEARQCPDGGWNYGNATVNGVDLRGYAQTTAVALQALVGSGSATVERGLAFLRGAWRDEPGGLTLAQSLVALRLHRDRGAIGPLERALADAHQRTHFLGNVLVLAWAVLATGPQERIDALRGGV